MVQEVFEEPDKHTSGADWLPELDKIIRLAPSRTFDVLICREVDRLARNRFKQLATEIELENHGVTVEYAVGQFEDTDEGRLLKGLVSEFAEYERGKIRRRTSSGKLRSVEAGNVTVGGSGAPYGYDLEVVNGKRILAINEQDAGVVRLIFDLYAVKGYSLIEVGEYLDRHKVPLPAKGNNHRKCSKGATWSIGTIGRLLNQETYTGHWHYRKTQTVKDATTRKTRIRPRPRNEWMEIHVPMIISDELFEAAQQRREINKRLMGHQNKYEYTLGGMIRCARCNSCVTGVTHVAKGRAYSYYKCGAAHSPKRYDFRCYSVQLRSSVVEAAVWVWIRSLLLEPETLRRAIVEYQSSQLERVRPQLAMLESSQARLCELEAQKTRLIDAYAKGVLSLDELASQKVALDKQIGDLDQTVAALRAEAEPLLLSAERVQSIEAIAAKYRDGALLADDDKQAQRAIFQLLDVHVILNHYGKERWADVTCTIGHERCAIDYPIMKFQGADNLIATNTLTNTAITRQIPLLITVG